VTYFPSIIIVNNTAIAVKKLQTQPDQLKIFPLNVMIQPLMKLLINKMLDMSSRKYLYLSTSTPYGVGHGF